MTFPKSWHTRNGNPQYVILQYYNITTARFHNKKSLGAKLACLQYLQTCYAVKVCGILLKETTTKEQLTSCIKKEQENIRISKIQQLVSSGPKHQTIKRI